MVKITYIDHGGTHRIVDVPEQLTVMEGALRHRIPGIDGDCGGAGACGTCHVYVSQEWFEKLPPVRELERATLNLAVEPRSNSRLACQIVLTPELDGLVVETPEHQF
jgi:2Fe-2S ferredoxin